MYQQHQDYGNKNMIDEKSIIETINMIKLYNLDIRTVTLALSLRDCISEDIDKVGDNIYNKIKKYHNIS